MLLSKLEDNMQISTECIDDCKEFISTVFNYGKARDSYLQTRINLHERQSAKFKSTMIIPSDEDLHTQHIFHLRTETVPYADYSFDWQVRKWM